mgnify:CR=1 FL=1
MTPENSKNRIIINTMDTSDIKSDLIEDIKFDNVKFNINTDVAKQNRDTEVQSIDIEVNQKKIEDRIGKLIPKYKIDKPDQFSNEFIEFFINNNEIIFKLVKAEEIFCNYENDTSRVIDYLIFRYKFRMSAQNKFAFESPLYLLIEPVSTCNLRCPFCFQTDKTFTKKPYMGVMDYDLFTKTVDEANEIGVRAITLGSRGEPTLHKRFADMIKYISDKENIFELKINTNATFLTEKVARAVLENKVNQIVISSDHYEKEEYERLRLGSNFEKVVGNVDRLYEMRKNNFPKSITEIRISGVDNEKNLDRKKFREFWIKRSDHVVAQWALERWNTYLNDTIDHLIEPCEYLFDRMYVWFDGKVNPCDADYKSYLSYGDVNENSISEIWNGPKIKKLRSDHLNNKRNQIEPCNKCGVQFH